MLEITIPTTFVTLIVTLLNTFRFKFIDMVVAARAVAELRLAMDIKTFLENALYLSSLVSDQSMFEPLSYPENLPKRLIVVRYFY